MSDEIPASTAQRNAEFARRRGYASDAPAAAPTPAPSDAQAIAAAVAHALPAAIERALAPMRTELSGLMQRVTQLEAASMAEAAPSAVETGLSTATHNSNFLRVRDRKG